MSKKKQTENVIRPELKKYYELSTESLGAYLLNYLQELKNSVNKDTKEIHDKITLRELILLFQQKVENIQSNTVKSSKLRRELELQFNVLAKYFNNIFFHSAPPQRMWLTSDGKLINTKRHCVKCSMKLKQGWRFHTNLEDIYFCTHCYAQLFETGNFKPTNTWSKIVFSAFESNRRRH